MASIAASPSASWTNRVNKPNRLILAPSDELFEPLLSDSRVRLVYLTGEVCVLECVDPTLVQDLLTSQLGWTRIF